MPRLHQARTAKSKANFGRTASLAQTLPDKFTPDHVHTLIETMRATVRYVFNDQHRANFFYKPETAERQ